MFSPPEWHDRAACRGRHDLTPLFFVEGQSVEAREVRARVEALCGVCPVRAECHWAAVENDERWGVWGGQGPEARRKARKAGVVEETGRLISTD